MNLYGLTISGEAAERAGLIAGETTAVQVSEERAFTLRDAPTWFREALYGGPTGSGMSVNEDSAMQIAAVFAAVRILAESVASLPLKVYRRDGRTRTAAPDHVLYGLLHDAGNDLMTAFQLREVWMVHMSLWGNSYSEIERNGRGQPVALWPIHPSRVQPVIDTSGRAPAVTYRITLPNGGQASVTSGNILHLKALGYDGVIGKSPIRLAREALGISMAAERYGAKFFGNDARPGMVLTHPAKLSDEAFDNLKNSWNSAHQGAGNAWKVAILEEGMDAKTVGLPPEDAQFIETRKFQISEIARIFRVPPHLLADLDKATFSNIEQQSLEFVIHSLRPWLVRIEQEINRQLLQPSERGTYYAEHTVDGLLRGDIKSRNEAYAIGRNWGWLSANDIREMENLNPVDDGDVYLQPLNMVPAGQPPDPVLRDARSEARSKESRALPPRFNAAQSMEPVFLDTFRRAVKRETAEIRKAVDKYLPQDRTGFSAWLESFVDEHARWMEPRLLPVYQMMAEAMRTAAQDEIGSDVPAADLDQFIVDYTQAYVNRHAGSTRGQIEALVEGEDPDAAVTERLDDWDETRAGKDARRERQRSSNAFTKAAWALAGVSAIVWRTVGSKTCPYCTSLSGARTSITKYFLGEGDSIKDLTVRTHIGHPPLHDGCLPGDALVLSRSRIAASSQRWYDGDLIVILTASGKKLSCTPNHPVLTPSGWVKAGLLNVGSRVVSSRLTDRDAAPVRNDKDVPARIEDIAKTLGGSSEVVTMEVVGSAEDFHGDGRDGEVTIIRTHSELLNEVHASLTQQGGKVSLRVGDAVSDVLLGDSGTDTGIEGVGATTLCPVCGDGLLLPLLGRHLGGSDTSRSAAASQGNTGLSQAEIDDVPADAKILSESIDGSAGLVLPDEGGSVEVEPVGAHPADSVATAQGNPGIDKAFRDGVATYTELSGQGEDGLAGLVFPDEVVEVRHEAFSGYVFNLQTEYGFYIANGIVTHNCDCILMPVVGARKQLSVAELRSVFQGIIEGKPLEHHHD